MKDLDREVAEALGYKAWKEKRGEHALCVWAAPNWYRPWECTKQPEEAKKKYTEVSLQEAVNIGFFGREIPKFSTDWAATGPLIEKHGIQLMKNPLGNCWFSRIRDKEQTGKTPLIAVCRAIIAMNTETETITESLSAIKQLPDGEYQLDSTGTLIVKNGKMTVI